MKAQMNSFFTILLHVLKGDLLIDHGSTALQKSSIFHFVLLVELNLLMTQRKFLITVQIRFR